MRGVSQDVTVIGGGVLGLLVAYLAASGTKRRVRMYRLSDAGSPQADSLRNHSWLQSGLLYAEHLLEAARLMRWSGIRMLRMFSIEPPTQRGVFRFKDENAVDRFLQEATSLRLRGQVELLTEAAARQLLGPMFLPDLPCVQVPDAPFDEAALLEAIRSAAQDSGVEMINLDPDQGVRLVPDSTSYSGFKTIAEGCSIESELTFLCAGAGNTLLLNQLQIPHPLAVYRSALLILESRSLMNAPLLADRHSGVTVLRHKTRLLANGESTIVGNARRTQLSLNRIRRRTVTGEELRELIQSLPIVCQDQVRDNPFRMVAGHKTEAIGANGRPSVRPWIGTWEQFPGLLAMVPGKATLGLWTAEQGLAISGISDRKHSLSIRGHIGTVHEWTDDIMMHWEYADLDERAT